MNQHTETKIRERAYALWEQSGKTTGKAMDFWLQAEKEINEAGKTSPAAASKVKRPARKAKGTTAKSVTAKAAGKTKAAKPKTAATAKPKTTRKKKSDTA